MMLDVAIAGLGRWGQVLVNSVHGRNDAGLRFVAGCTGRPERAADYAAARGIDLLPGLDAVLADPRIAAVVLATPHAQHAAQVIAAAAAGKHVFVEKPFALARADAVAAVAACARAGVVLAVGHNRRFLPAVAAMKAMLATGALGTVLHAEGHFSGPGASAYTSGMWRADRAESPLGGMGGMGIHMVDMLIHLLGPIAQVDCRSHARALTNGLDDTTAALFTFAHGATANFATLALAPRHWRVAIFGTEGILELHGHEDLRFTPRQGQGWSRQFEPLDIEAAELAAFATAVAGGADYPLPVEEAIHGVAVFEAMIHSAASGGPQAVA